MRLNRSYQMTFALRSGIVLAVGLAILLAVPTFAQIAFTYQGFLKESGTPANGAYDFRFRLWTAASGGTQVGTDQFVNDLTVQNGLFTTELNFGSVWDGSERYLEIGVRPGSSTGDYTTLSPRVKINPTPYAAFALRPWQTAGSAVFYNDGNVGIGTNAPAARLSLGGGDANTKLALWQGGTAAEVMGFGIGPNQFRLHLHHSGNRFSFLDAPNGSELVTILGTGRVGIGTNAPESLLHVFAGSAGTVTAEANSVLTLEHSTHAYLSLLTPNGNERGILFGQPSSNVAGGIIYNNAATPNGLQFRTNGNVTRMVIDGSGNVGVGLTSPTAKLHIRGGNLRVDDGEIQSWGPITLHPDVDNSDDDIVRFVDSAGSEVMRVHSNGNVGIGTSSPSHPLHVRTGAGERAIYGLHTAASGYTAGVFGESASGSGAGVAGLASAASGYSSGVFGESISPQGRGVTGFASASSGYALGVFGQAGSPEGRGVAGLATATRGDAIGVWGQSNSPDGKGVFGRGTASSGEAFGGYFQTDSPQGRGVLGWASSGAGSPIGVFGQSNSAFGFGVYCVGNFAVVGGKAFQIDHPLRPETHYLNHFCTEGPEPYNAYSGNVVTDAQGYAVVQLPDYFESINRDFRYQLTVIDGAGEEFVQARVVRKIQNNRFVIRTSKPFVEVSWRVEAVRNDRWMQRHGFQTEQEKPEWHRGKYLNPELYGQPKERGIHYRPEPERPHEAERPK